MRVNREDIVEIVVSVIVSIEKPSLTSGILSIPNAITLARLVMLPVFL